MPLTGTTRIESSVQAKTQVTGELENATSTLNSTLTHNWTSGNGNNQAQICFTDERTVSASSDDDIDIDGYLTNVAGESVQFAAIKFVRVENIDTTATNLLRVTPPSAFGSGYQIARGGYVSGTNPGGSVQFVAPDATGYVISGGDVFRITNPMGTAVDYRIIIVGIS